MGSHGADPAKYEMIAKGMTFTEVEEILGKPRWNRTLDDGTVLWTYGRPLKWCTVQIRFDEDGSVVSKEHDH